MRKQKKQLFKKSLCGILSAAMILTGFMIPDLSVYAAPLAVENPAENDDADGTVDETPDVENKETVESSEADSGDGESIDSGQEETGTSDEAGEDEVQTSDENTTGDDDQNNDDAEDGDIADESTEDVTDDETEEIVVSDGEECENAAAVAEDGKYENVTVNFNYYVGELEDGETVGLYNWANSGGALSSANEVASWNIWNAGDVYQMNSVEGHPGWYSIIFTVTDTITADGSLTGIAVYKYESAKSMLFECSGYSNKYPEIYTGLLSGEITAVKDGKGYASIEDAEVSTDALAALVAEAKKLKEGDYKALGWKAFSEALTAAEAVLAKENPTGSEVEEAYDNLEKAMNALVPATSVEAEINVKPIALSDEFITGADISSYWSLRQSGTVFRDENGNALSDAEFFQYLHDGGTNWVRIRVWNDPYDSNGNGYGGGNNDLEKAIIMGKLATDADMRVLIDFHYSDFWADPGKQQAPKAWAELTIEERADAVYQFTKDSLNALKDAGVDVGMVQVGNETTNGICGVFYSDDGWENAAKIYNAGSKAVREFDKDCLVAVHFTNPERANNYANLAKNLHDNNVDYDVFASSYYPFWHGTTENLTSVLAYVAKTYGKKVMVAETSWATTLDDQDGHDNTVRVGQNDTGNAYAFSVQGQADEIRAVVEAANNVNNVDGAAGSSIGVFYWESAWISPYYVYDEDGNKNEELYNKNKEAWEKYGSGWASSYGGEYDPDDAGKWYGGSAVDNQAWFGFDGSALPTAKIYSYIRTGAEAEKAIKEVTNPSITVKEGESVDYPEKVTVTFNDGTSDEYPVVWDEDDKAQVDTTEPGNHTVRGIVTCNYTVSDGSTKTATSEVTLTITVEMTSVAGLVNPGFEDSDMSAWSITEGIGTARKKEDPHSGTWGVHFYNASAKTSTIMQKIEGLEAGTYIFGGYIQGDTASKADAVVKIYDRDDNLKTELRASCSLEGWAVWQNPEVVGIVVSEGDYLEVGMEVNASAGGWGTIDDFYLYSAHEYSILVDDQIKNGTLSCNLEKATAGQTITITATPEPEYALTKLMISGRNVQTDIFTSEHGTVTYDEKTSSVILTYNDMVTEKTEEPFTMPNGRVTVSAVFRKDVDIAALEELVSAYQKVKNDHYTEASWQAFTEALEAAKEVLENLDATQEQIDNAKAALEAAYEGLSQKRLRAEWTDEWAELLGNSNSITYTGKAFKPTVKVYDGETLLTSKSYSVTYKNNTKVGEASVIIRGKGNYTGSDTLKFTIAPVNLRTDKNVNISDLYVAPAKNGNKVSVKPVVTWNGKKVNAKMYEVVLSDEGKVENAYVSPGTYNVEIKAKDGNGIYVGSRKIKITIIDPAEQVLMSNVKIKFNFKSKTWIAGGVTLTDSDIKATYTVKKQTDTLTFGEDYTLEYENNTEIGTATVIIKGTGTSENGGKYVGEQRKTFKITGTAIKAKNVSLVTKSFVYDGTEKKPGVTVTVNNEVLEENKDFTVTYQNNTRVGRKATVVIKGINGYSGTVKKTFSITAYDVTEEDITEKNIKIDVAASVLYEKGGSKPAVKVTFKGNDLVQDTDYTLSYEKNTKVTSEDSPATVKIKGKGNFKGTATVEFKIGKQDLANLTATAADQTSAKKWNKVSPVIKDLNGKALKKGTDYEKTFAYALYNAQGVQITDITTTPPAAGMTVKVTVTGKNNYEGTITAEFRIIDSKDSFSQTRATITPQTYTGKEIELKESDIKLEIKTGKKTWKEISADQYEIIGYSNNVNKGKKAKVTIHGLDPYGGTKTFNFEIKAQPMELVNLAARMAAMLN